MKNSILLTPRRLNQAIECQNRVFMAPMTRNMATDEYCATDAMADYYAKRASVGLIITEGTVIRPDGRGYSNTPAIYTLEHIEAWRNVTDKVHANGGQIFCQIWHVGRVSHPHYLNGDLPLSCSETTMSGPVRRSDGLNYGKCRAVTIDEINGLIASYADAAKNAMAAGFDGVEIHGANGYLIDQFLHHDTNKRTDEYGGTPEKMARFALDVVNACGSTIGFERVSLRISPGAYLNEILGDPRDADVFAFLLNQLSNTAIAYIHTGNFDDAKAFPELANQTMTQFIRTHYKGTLVACGGYSAEEAERKISDGEFDCVAIGRPLIANPDYIAKIRSGETLTEYDASMLGTLS